MVRVAPQVGPIATDESMTDTTTHENQVALFRYGLISELLHPDPSRTLNARMTEKAARDYVIPGSTRTRVAVETLRDWLDAYREGGFDALKPKPRADKGKSRAIPQQVADALMTIKEEAPKLTVAEVIEQARSVEGLSVPAELPLSTVHRLLSRAGLMHKPKDEPSSKDRLRFAHERAGQLWLGDVMHGPAVRAEERRKRKSYLVAFLDDCSRVVPAARFALHENTRCVLPVLREGIERRGLCERLYVDQGSAYRSQHLSLVCAKVGITLIHARPYQPQGKGKIERFFRTVRMQFLKNLSDADLESLETLNRRLWAWVEAEYHQRPHRGLGGETPLDVWARTATAVRTTHNLDLREAFLFEHKRKVQRDRTVSLGGTVYEVDAALVGETVTLRFDPAQKPGAPIDVWHAGKKIQAARVVDSYANCFVRRNHDTKNLEPTVGPNEPKKGLDMRHIKKEHS